jgi:hypothetical protein
MDVPTFTLSLTIPVISDRDVAGKSLFSCVKNVAPILIKRFPMMSLRCTRFMALRIVLQFYSLKIGETEASCVLGEADMCAGKESGV